MRRNVVALGVVLLFSIAKLTLAETFNTQPQPAQPQPAQPQPAQPQPAQPQPAQPQPAQPQPAQPQPAQPQPAQPQPAQPQPAQPQPAQPQPAQPQPAQPQPAQPQPAQPQPQIPRTLTPADEAAIKALFDKAVTKAQDQPTHITCSVNTLTCSPAAVFISAATISVVEVTDIGAKQSLTVRLASGETDDSGTPIIVRRQYGAAVLPDRITIAIHRERKYNQTFKTTARRTEAIEHFLNLQSNIPSSVLREDNPTIAFVSLGKSEALSVQLSIDGAQPKTIPVILNYQRWLVDMGGFITFGFVADQELALNDEGSGNVKVLKKRSKDKIVPGTGIVLNFHPANYPEWAAQFGLATSVDRAASYYLGFGYRLRELGPRTLATFAVGLAATQVKRFPDVRVGDIRPATAKEVTTATDRYAFGPYLSLSLGFSFGNDTSQRPTAPQQ